MADSELDDTSKLLDFDDEGSESDSLDLEIQEPLKNDNERAMTDYRAACARLHIFPVKSIVEDTLVRLNINCNNRGLREKDIEAISTVVKMASEKESHREVGIRSIDLSGNQIGVYGMHLLTQALTNEGSTTAQIMHLHLNNVGLRYIPGNEPNRKRERKRVDGILLSIMHMPRLIDLDLGSNKIGDRGMKLLYDEPFSNDIFRLILSDVGMTWRSAECAAQMVDEHPLYEYDVSWNNIGPSGMSKFFKYLKTIQRWQDEMYTLDVSHTGITETCYEDLCEFFHNERFPNCHLIFYPNRIGGDMVTDICLLEYLNMIRSDFQPNFQNGNVGSGELNHGKIGEFDEQNAVFRRWLSQKHPNLIFQASLSQYPNAVLAESNSGKSGGKKKRKK